MIFAAIDPGSVNAAIAVFANGKPNFVDDLRTANRMLDATALAATLEAMRVQEVIVEDVHSMPRQGVASSFNFGKGVGIIHGVCGALRLPVVLVAPTSWKLFHRLNSEKEKARALALRKFPHLNEQLQHKKDINKAEALLIGEWFRAVRRIEATDTTHEANLQDPFA